MTSSWIQPRESGLPFRLPSSNSSGFYARNVLSYIEFQLCQEITTLIRSVPLDLRTRFLNWNPSISSLYRTHETATVITVGSAWITLPVLSLLNEVSCWRSNGLMLIQIKERRSLWSNWESESNKNCRRSKAGPPAVATFSKHPRSGTHMNKNTYLHCLEEPSPRVNSSPSLVCLLH